MLAILLCSPLGNAYLHMKSHEDLWTGWVLNQILVEQAAKIHGCCLMLATQHGSGVFANSWLYDIIYTLYTLNSTLIRPPICHIFPQFLVKERNITILGHCLGNLFCFSRLLCQAIEVHGHSIFSGSIFQDGRSYPQKLKVFDVLDLVSRLLSTDLDSVGR